MKSFIIAALASQAWAAGVDVSQPVSADSAKCFVEGEHFKFAVVRSWCSDGTYCLNEQSVKELHSAGMPRVDLYSFPCADSSAAKQVTTLIKTLKERSVKYHTLWHDIETNNSPGCSWSSNKADNCKLLKEMIAAASAAGVKQGVYCSNHMWGLIMGSECKVGNHKLPLWYAHYESPSQPNFHDWVPFGGWTTPKAKQYKGTSRVCGMGVDLNYSPEMDATTTTAATAEEPMEGVTVYTRPGGLRGVQ